MLRNPGRRRGFTLVELLVAIGLALVVLGLVIAVSQSSLGDSYKVTGAGDRLSQFLMTARNRAVRDKAPRGVRILNDEAGRAAVIQYTEAPEAWVPTGDQMLHVYYPSDGTAVPVAPPVSGAAAANHIRVLLSGSSTSLQAAFQDGSVQVGDLLSVPDLGWAYRIAGIITPPNPATPPTAVVGTFQVELRLQIYPDLGAGFSDTAAATPRSALATNKFGIFRQARELLGEPTQALAAGMAVDFSNSLPNTLSAPFDVLFAPTGEIMNSNGSVISLLLRDFSYRGSPAAGTALTAANQSTTGEMILVAIYPRTGSVATKAVAPLSASNTDLHKFAKDGINSGL